MTSGGVGVVGRMFVGHSLILLVVACRSFGFEPHVVTMQTLHYTLFAVRVHVN